jgi:hypothetical protein
MSDRAVRHRTLVGVALALLLPVFAAATEWKQLSTAERIRAAERVARVTLSEERVVSLEFEGRHVECGHRYLAKVLESLKGTGGSFEFVSDAVLPLGDAQYVVAVQRKAGDDDATGRAAADTLKGPLRDYLHCRLADDTQYVETIVFAFDAVRWDDLRRELERATAPPPEPE